MSDHIDHNDSIHTPESEDVSTAPVGIPGIESHGPAAAGMKRSRYSVFSQGGANFTRSSHTNSSVRLSGVQLHGTGSSNDVWGAAAGAGAGSGLGVTRKSPPRAAALLQFAVVCACNMNRSMAAHIRLSDAGYHVSSYGVARTVKLRSKTGTRAYTWDQEYSIMLKDMVSTSSQETEWAKKRGLVDLLQRNIKVKSKPERWQSLSTEFVAQQSIIITYQDRVFEMLMDDVESRPPRPESQAVHVVNITTRDDPQSAYAGADVSLALVNMACAVADRALGHTVLEQDEEQPEVGGDAAMAGASGKPSVADLSSWTPEETEMARHKAMTALNAAMPSLLEKASEVAASTGGAVAASVPLYAKMHA